MGRFGRWQPATREQNEKSKPGLDFSFYVLVGTGFEAAVHGIGGAFADAYCLCTFGYRKPACNTVRILKPRLKWDVCGMENAGDVFCKGASAVFAKITLFSAGLALAIDMRTTTVRTCADLNRRFAQLELCDDGVSQKRSHIALLLRGKRCHIQLYLLEKLIDN